MEQASIHDLLMSMGANYDLVDAFVQQEFRNGKTIYRAQFTFYRSDLAEVNGTFTKRQDDVWLGFNNLCRDSLWSTEVYVNPYTAKGAAPGDIFLSVNCCSRTPLLDENSRPVLVHERDEQGQKTGRKVLLRPKYSFRLKEAIRELVAA